IRPEYERETSKATPRGRYELGKSEKPAETLRFRHTPFRHVFCNCCPQSRYKASEHRYGAQYDCPFAKARNAQDPRKNYGLYQSRGFHCEGGYRRPVRTSSKPDCDIGLQEPAT